MGLIPTFFPTSTDSQPHKPIPPPYSSSTSMRRIIASSTKQKLRQKQHHVAEKQLQIREQVPPFSWNQLKNLLSCKQTLVHDPSKNPILPQQQGRRSSCGSFRDVVHGNARVVHRADNSPETSSLGQETRLLTRKPAQGSSSRSLASSVTAASSSSSSTRGMQLRKLSGCYECHIIADPRSRRYPITPRATVCACSQCGEIFPKLESLEHHQAVMHAVSELGPEDSGGNIVEIIFKSSWRNKLPMCKIERILKVHNTQRTIQRFEECREAVKGARGKKNPRCAADGNELLRFHCAAPLACDIGANGSTSLCSCASCGVCPLIRHGFQSSQVSTTATSGRAHHGHGRRAMLVCRVIAGRISRAPLPDEDAPANSYDSMAPTSGVEDLVVLNPRAILPCFVVIYNTLTLN